MLDDLVGLIEQAKRNAVRSVNLIMTTMYWSLGKRIIEQEQQGKERAQYGQELLHYLSHHLTERFGRGFSITRLEDARRFYSIYAQRQIPQTVSGELKVEGKNRKVPFPLSWSHYVLLIRRTRSEEARAFYEAEALRGGWSVRQLERQIDSQFYERALLSKNKANLLKKETPAKPEYALTPEEEIKNPFVLEFLGLKDEYSESKLEEALIANLEAFLLELGNDFTFVGRQRRLRVGSEWYRIDLLFFHRRLRCLVIIDLKIGRLTHADVGQMHLYVNYAREHWRLEGENPPVGLILCSQKEDAVVHYALEGITNKVLASEYKTKLPDEKLLVEELNRTRNRLEERVYLSK